MSETTAAKLGEIERWQSEATVWTGQDYLWLNRFLVTAALLRSRDEEAGKRTLRPPDPATVPQWGVPDWQEWARKARASSSEDAAMQEAGKLREALHEAQRLRYQIFVATPVREETADVHFDLEHLRQVINGGLSAKSAADQDER